MFKSDIGVFVGVWTVLLTCAVGAPAFAAAQDPAPRANVRITTTDVQQFPIPGAICTLIPAGAPRGEPATSNDHGVCTYSGVEPGTYIVRVEIDGFESFSRASIVVAGGDVNIPALLAVARVAQSVTVSAATDATTGMTAGSVPPAANLERSVLRRLPLATAAFDAALPLVPGVLRSATGELSFNGATERQSSLLVNGMNAVDPATGNFRLSLPIDSVEAVQVFLHPYTAEFGQFTGGVTRVYTREGGDRWHFELNDFLPDLRFVHGRVVVIAEDAPHLNVGGPLFSGRLHVSQSLAYTIAKTPVRGLDFPDNETRTESESSFSQIDANLWRGHSERTTFGFAPERDDFVGLDVFRPKPVTPSRTQRDAWLTLRDNSEVGGGLLTSAMSFRRFGVEVFGQGTGELTLTPTGETGSYYARQDRESTRFELFESFALPTHHWLGAHDVKFGVDVNRSGSVMNFSASPVDIVRADGALARRIEFNTSPAIHAANLEATGFVQDRWTVGPRFSVDLGLRYEDQRIADPHVIVPRAGFAWALRDDGATVVRGGLGLFYDKVPLNIRSFAQYPSRVITRYAADGTTILDQRTYQNVLADAEQPRVVNNKNVEDETAFVPINLTWNLEVDHSFSQDLTIRANVVSSETEDIYIVQPRAHASGTAAILLSSTGSSRYRALELTGRIGPAGHGLNVSYTHSRARGDLNDFNASFGDFASPILRTNQYSQLPEDVPNRFIAWGSLSLPSRVTFAPVFEARTGFPYSIRDEEQNFVGVRNADSTRFPWFIALDAELAKEFRVSRNYGIRLSVRGFNLTNRFNPRDVRANLADPGFGQFLASYRRYFAWGFDIVF
ncbi:MAG TPA: TonB-dependent receptor [Vicinamibacterales bacterium]|nr:TonB-dependent receptor [Vicinamibacterales bacterium]